MEAASERINRVRELLKEKGLVKRRFLIWQKMYLKRQKFTKFQPMNSMIALSMITSGLAALYYGQKTLKTDVYNRCSCLYWFSCGIHFICLFFFYRSWHAYLIRVFFIASKINILWTLFAFMNLSNYAFLTTLKTRIREARGHFIFYFVKSSLCKCHV